MQYFCDSKRHLVCLPYSVDNLHRMAEDLGIKRCWFEVSKLGHAHYDIPAKRVREIQARCQVVSPRRILEIIKGGEEKPDFTEDDKEWIAKIDPTKLSWEGCW